MRDHQIKQINKAAGRREISFKSGAVVVLTIQDGGVVRKAFPPDDRTVHDYEVLGDFNSGYSPSRTIDYYTLEFLIDFYSDDIPNTILKVLNGASQAITY